MEYTPVGIDGEKPLYLQCSMGPEGYDAVRKELAERLFTKKFVITDLDAISFYTVRKDPGQISILKGDPRQIYACIRFKSEKDIEEAKRAVEMWQNTGKRQVQMQVCQEVPLGIDPAFESGSEPMDEKQTVEALYDNLNDAGLAEFVLRLSSDGKDKGDTTEKSMELEMPTTFEQTHTKHMPRPLIPKQPNQITPHPAIPKGLLSHLKPPQSMSGPTLTSIKKELLKGIDTHQPASAEYAPGLAELMRSDSPKATVGDTERQETLSGTQEYSTLPFMPSTQVTQSTTPSLNPMATMSSFTHTQGPSGTTSQVHPGTSPGIPISRLLQMYEKAPLPPRRAADILTLDPEGTASSVIWSAAEGAQRQQQMDGSATATSTAIMNVPDDGSDSSDVPIIDIFYQKSNGAFSPTPQTECGSQVHGPNYVSVSRSSSPINDPEAYLEEQYEAELLLSQQYAEMMTPAHTGGFDMPSSAMPSGADDSHQGMYGALAHFSSEYTSMRDPTRFYSTGTDYTQSRPPTAKPAHDLDERGRPRTPSSRLMTSTYTTASAEEATDDSSMPNNVKTVAQHFLDKQSRPRRSSTVPPKMSPLAKTQETTGYQAGGNTLPRYSYMSKIGKNYEDTRQTGQSLDVSTSKILRPKATTSDISNLISDASALVEGTINMWDTMTVLDASKVNTQSAGSAIHHVVNAQGLVNEKAYVYGHHVIGENIPVEFISFDRPDFIDYDLPYAVCKFMTGMLNYRGGIILIGVRKTNNGNMVEGIPASNGHLQDRIQVLIDETVAKITPRVYPEKYSVHFSPVLDMNNREDRKGLSVVEITVRRGHLDHLYATPWGDVFFQSDNGHKWLWPHEVFDEAIKRLKVSHEVTTERIKDELKEMHNRKQTISYTTAQIMEQIEYLQRVRQKEAQSLATKLDYYKGQITVLRDHRVAKEREAAEVEKQLEKIVDQQMSKRWDMVQNMNKQILEHKDAVEQAIKHYRKDNIETKIKLEQVITKLTVEVNAMSM